MSVAVSGSVTKVEPIQNADRIRRADVDCDESTSGGVFSFKAISLKHKD